MRSAGWNQAHLVAEAVVSCAVVIVDCSSSAASITGAAGTAPPNLDEAGVEASCCFRSGEQGNCARRDKYSCALDGAASIGGAAIVFANCSVFIALSGDVTSGSDSP